MTTKNITASKESREPHTLLNSTDAEWVGIIPATKELREQHVEELEAEGGPEWAKTHQPGSVSCHELLDRTSLIADNVENFIVAHPACVQNKEWFALAERAASALHELYQKVGAEHLEQE